MSARQFEVKTLQPLWTRNRPAKMTKKRREIYLQAARMFVANGFAATSMSDLAEAVNLTKAGLYHSISSKEDLLFTLISNAMDDFDEQVLEPAIEVADAFERLKVSLKLHIANITRLDEHDGNPMTRIADQVSGLSPERQDIVAQRKRRYLDMLSATLDEMAEKGQLRQGLDTRVAALSITMMIIGINSWRRPAGRLSKQEISDQVMTMALHSVVNLEILESYQPKLVGKSRRSS
jgi:TetR/AcrR family transcriptional regulator, cholesterol catabolism regulator